MTERTLNCIRTIPIESRVQHSREATPAELSQYYKKLDGIYNELNGDIALQSTELRAAGPILVESGVGDGVDSAQVWRLDNSDDPAFRVRLRLHGKRAAARDSWIDHTLLVHESGRATYGAAESKPVKCGTLLVPVKSNVLDKRTPSLDDLATFDDAFLRILAPDSANNRKLRFPTHLVGWLFGREVKMNATSVVR